ncbi:hypothetical protein [Streptomyces sp. NPDC020607]|uniref:hypothetical protein n=1 Tax=Streptomyces sp. NPDC020607 TaxID=3365082 RepID=UPI0037B98D6B
MTNVDPRPPARPRLDAALERLAVTLRGETAHPDETQCDCHWGPDEDVELLRVPGVELDPELLARTWQVCDWRDKPAMTRRILPQLAVHLVYGLVVPPLHGMAEVGHFLANGAWQEWPAEQAAAVEEFLRAWWAWTLTQPDPPEPAHEIFALCTEASGTPEPWLGIWERLTGPVPDRHLALAVTEWEYELLGDRSPWQEGEEDERKRERLSAWLVRHAPARLRAHGASEDLLHRVRILGVEIHSRWDDPHWPGHRYA